MMIADKLLTVERMFHTRLHAASGKRESGDGMDDWVSEFKVYDRGVIGV